MKTDSVYAFSISRKWLVIVGLKGADTTSFALRCPKANFSTLLLLHFIEELDRVDKITHKKDFLILTQIRLWAYVN